MAKKKAAKKTSGQPPVSEATGDAVRTARGSSAESSAAKTEDGYVVVARRYRPKTFGELVGQGHVGKALSGAIETGRVGHAYLFTGARGVGKTSTARIFAKALNNPDGPSIDFDGESDISQAIDSGEDVDVIEIDGASNRGIDEIRSLRANAGVRPSRGRYKIYIIDEVHMLTGPAFNALLKTLEEPPEHVKFIFCTTDPEKIPITVLSRCQRFDFAPVEVGDIVGRLREIVDNENADADDAALELIARRAAGSMRDSQSLLEQVLSFADGRLDADTVHQILGTADDTRLHELTRTMADGDAAAALGLVDDAIDGGIDAGRLAEQLLEFLRDLLAATAGCDANLMRYTSASLHGDLKEIGDRWGLQTVLAVVGIIDHAISRIRLSVHGRVLLEAAVIQICRLPDLQGIADLAAAGANASPKRSGAAEKKKLAPPAEPNGRVAETGPPAGTVNAARSADRPPVPNRQETPSGKVTNDVPDDRSADAIWRRVEAALPDLTRPMVQSVASVDVDSDGGFVVRLPSGSDMSARRLASGTHRDAVAAALNATRGDPRFRIETLKAAADSPAASPPAKEKPNRATRMRQAEGHPLVQAIIETFDAVVTKVDIAD